MRTAFVKPKAHVAEMRETEVISKTEMYRMMSQMKDELRQEMASDRKKYDHEFTQQKHIIGEMKKRFEKETTILRQQLNSTREELERTKLSVQRLMSQINGGEGLSGVRTPNTPGKRALQNCCDELRKRVDIHDDLHRNHHGAIRQLQSLISAEENQSESSSRKRIRSESFDEYDEANTAVDIGESELNLEFIMSCVEEFNPLKYENISDTYERERTQLDDDNRSNQLCNMTYRNKTLQSIGLDVDMKHLNIVYKLLGQRKYRTYQYDILSSDEIRSIIHMINDRFNQKLLSGRIPNPNILNVSNIARRSPMLFWNLVFIYTNLHNSDFHTVSDAAQNIMEKLL